MPSLASRIVTGTVGEEIQAPGVHAMLTICEFMLLTVVMVHLSGQKLLIEGSNLSAPGLNLPLLKTYTECFLEKADPLLMAPTRTSLPPRCCVFRSDFLGPGYNLLSSSMKCLRSEERRVGKECPV